MLGEYLIVQVVIVLNNVRIECVFGDRGERTLRLELL